MKSVGSLMVFIISVMMVHSQTNIIYNGSLEEKNLCPVDMEDIAAIQGWYNPTDATPNVFCRGCVGIFNDSLVPKNPEGCQEPADGNNYGFILTTFIGNYREYLGVKLSYPYLQKDSIYIFEIKVSLCDCSGVYCGGCIMGVFTDSLVRSATIGVLPLAPSFVFDTAVADAKNWVTLKADYTATGKEAFLIIGNFKRNDEVKYSYRKYKPSCLKVKYTPVTEGSAYYIDDLKLYKKEE